VTASGYTLVRLKNGVHSVHSLRHDETFHPVIGPVAEAEALYVRQLRLAERLRDHRGEFVIWDVGLGAAANVLTVLRATREIPCPLRIVSFDHTLEPLRFALEHREELGYLGGYEEPIALLLHQTGSSPGIRFTDERRTVEWEVQVADFPTLLAEALREPQGRAGVPPALGSRDGCPTLRRIPMPTPDTSALPSPQAILFDAFSPATNPEMWTLPLFTNLFRLLDPARPCAMPTYSRSTMLRVTLLLAGFFVGAGHATGEKEQTTIAASALRLIDDPLDRAWLMRARRSTSAEPLHEPVYRQARLSAGTWERLQAHPQFMA
jgi:hypothetical protein